MIEQIGFIGVGHLAGYLVEGLRRACPDIEIVLSPRNAEKSAQLAARLGARVAADNQAVVDAVDLGLLTTRRNDAVSVCEGLSFLPGKVVVSTVPGLNLATLQPAVEPATLARAMPISCAALNRSPTLLYPDDPIVSALFGLLGQVHVLPDEARFAPASVIAAFYGWVYALLGETVAWTVRAGVPAQTARSLVLETVGGAVDMALSQPDEDLAAMLDTLATPGGITQHGLDILRQQHGVGAWTVAPDAVLDRVQGDE
ncbi:pyrroline-5-carboxylate reductase dimerization domain-containing protein [Chloroflexota bacterium]